MLWKRVRTTDVLLSDYNSVSETKQSLDRSETLKAKKFLEFCLEFWELDFSL